MIYLPNIMFIIEVNLIYFIYLFGTNQKERQNRWYERHMISKYEWLSGKSNIRLINGLDVLTEVSSHQE